MKKIWQTAFPVASANDFLWQHVVENGAGRSFADFANGVFAASRTFWKAPVRIQFNVRLDVGFRDNVSIFPAFFQGPLVFCRVNLAEIVGAGVALAGFRGR
jgi:hypothetical protein